MSSAAPQVRGSERERVLGPFLSGHWQLPVAPQGAPPAGFSEPEASLDPALCGACHPLQHAQWRTSLHAAAFSPGLEGQLIEGQLAEPAQLVSCQTCHVPLAEQQPFTAALGPNPDFDPELRAAGLTCAGCHVRAHQRLGPVRRADYPLPDPLPHGGFSERAEFSDSRFCAECHQFWDDAGINGKPVQNTYNEWRDSPQAAAGRQCQDCHMPDRSHTWRGIHDRDTVRAAIDVALLRDDTPDLIRAELVVTNRDVGHAFPTYVTPRVEVALFQTDAAGRELEGTRLDAWIARVVDLAAGSELLDSRISPGESVKLEYAQSPVGAAAYLVGRVTVHPDYNYVLIYDALLASLRDPRARNLIQQAREQASGSPYVLEEIRVALE